MVAKSPILRKSKQHLKKIYVKPSNLILNKMRKYFKISNKGESAKYVYI